MGGVSAHALLSASSAERWIACTPSARIEENMPDQSSIFSREGTAAHAFAETRLRHLLGQITIEEYKTSYAEARAEYEDAIQYWTHSEWDAINSYVEYVMSEVARLGGEVHIEKRVDYSKYAQGGFGTSDVLIYSKEARVVKSIDLKFGKGVTVYANDNTQAKLYALGGLLAFDSDGQVDHVEWAIVQPRLNYIGEDSMSRSDLISWAEEVVAPRAELAWAGKGNLVPTDKGCRFCKAAATCRARVAENVLIARRDFMPNPDPSLMQMDEIAKILPDLDSWIAWANKLKAHALEQVRDHGQVIPGYKLVRGRSNRAWKDGIDIAEELKAVGVSETAIYSEPAVRSVAQLEKSIGKKDFAEKAESLVTKPPGAPALVTIDDPRQGIDSVAEAAAEFNK